MSTFVGPTPSMHVEVRIGYLDVVEISIVSAFFKHPLAISICLRAGPKRLMKIDSGPTMRMQVETPI